MNIYLPIHIDGGNRGCEGIAKGSSQLLSMPKENILGLCSNVQLDTRLRVNDYVTLIKKPVNNLWFRVVNKLYNIFVSLRTKDTFSLSQYGYHHDYQPFLKRMNKGDIMLSTGGDMMCYGDNEVIYTNDYAKKHGVKTVLWGCSMGEENLTQRKQETLKKFDLVYARETLSYDFFKSLGLKNVACFPDPAFALEPEKTDLPPCFEKGNVIGINLSNYTVGAFNLNTPFGIEVRKLLNYIFNSTSYQVLLVPHVLWPGQDDRVIAENVLKEYSGFVDRITILNSKELNYLQIRYVISQCLAFIGGRTHAVISAYSTCVPTIALGYSIKSRGIAKDLGLPEKYVVDSKHISEENVLLGAFQDLESNIQEIKNHLCAIMPEYIGRTNEVKSILEKI